MDDSPLALLGENGDQVFHLSDEIYAEELQMQEVIQASLIVSTAIPDGDVRSEISTSNTGDSSRSFCEICTERKETNEMFRSETCNRSFCSECIRSHGKTEMKEYSVLRSDLNCAAPMGSEHVQLIVPEKEIAPWEVALCEATVLPAEKFYCPFKDCSALLVNDAAAGEVIKESECPICRRLFCAQCVMPWHAGLECEEVGKLGKDEREREDLMVRALAKDRKWMSCPNCKAIVERTHGCIKMTCRCKFEFCHVCGSKWDETHWGTCQRT